MAPLDMKFNNSGREAWLPFHGSWDRSDPSGYKLAMVSFKDDGMPVDQLTSTTAAKDIFANKDNSRCPADCFRPVALAIDQQGRIFMSSDASGEIYMVSRAVNSSGGASSSSGGQSGSSAGSTTNGSAKSLPSSAYLIAFVIAAFCMNVL